MSAFKKFKVLVIDKDIPKIAIDLLNTKCEVIIVGNATREEYIKELLHVDGALLYGHKLVVDQELLDIIGPRLKVISQMGVGVNHIDVPYVKSRKIQLGNTQNALDDCVAEVAIMLMLSVGHRAKEGYNKIKNGQWITNHPQWLLGFEIRNSVVGIIGFGNIGKAVATKLRSFSPARIVYCSRTDKSYAKELNVQRLPMVSLLQDSDFVIVCCPLTNETFHLINANSFKVMKNTSILINVARGEVIHQGDLITALKNGDIFGAGLDVTDPEPLPVNHPLLDLDNCVITPHLGSATLQTRSQMAEVAAKNILAALEGQSMPSPV